MNNLDGAALRLVESLQQAMSSPAKSKAAEKAFAAYYNRRKQTEWEVTTRLHETLLRLGNMLAVHACREAHPPQAHFYQRNPAFHACKKGVMQEQPKSRVSRPITRTYESLSASDRMYVIEGLQELYMVQKGIDEPHIPINIQSMPLVRVIAALDPQKMQAQLALLPAHQLRKLFRKSETFQNSDALGLFRERLEQMQATMSKPSKRDVDSALSMFLSPQLKLLFSGLLLPKYAIQSGGGLVTIVRQWWSKFVVFFFVLIVGIVDMLIYSTISVIVQPVVSALQSAGQNFIKNAQTNEVKAAGRLFGLGSAAIDGTHRVLRIMARKSVLLLGAEPDFVGKAFTEAT